MSMSPAEALPLVGDNFMDFVYAGEVPGRELVPSFLEAWWNKVKPEGVFAGVSSLKVIRDFCAKKDLRWQTLEQSRSCESVNWYLVKPKREPRL